MKLLEFTNWARLLPLPQYLVQLWLNRLFQALL